MILEICSTIGKKAQMILLGVRALDVGNASYPRRLGVTRVEPRSLDSSWHFDSKMLKITSIEGVSKKLWDFELGTA